MLSSFPHYRQLNSMDCGPSCLRMIAKFYGRVYSIQNLREKAFITREGVSMLGISEAAEAIGFRTQGGEDHGGGAGEGNEILKTNHFVNSLFLSIIAFES